MPPTEENNLTEKYANIRISEFHNRLKRNAAKVTCDIPKTVEEYLQNYDSLSDANKRILVSVLYLEMKQLLQTIEEAK